MLPTLDLDVVRVNNRGWAAAASCKLLADAQPTRAQAVAVSEMFWPTGQGGDTAFRAHRAMAICWTCPVQEECWQECVMSGNVVEGIWCQTTGRDRRPYRAAWNTYKTTGTVQARPPVSERWRQRSDRSGGWLAMLTNEICTRGGTALPALMVPHSLRVRAWLQAETENGGGK